MGTLSAAAAIAALGSADDELGQVLALYRAAGVREPERLTVSVGDRRLLALHRALTGRDVEVAATCAECETVSVAVLSPQTVPPHAERTAWLGLGSGLREPRYGDLLDLPADAEAAEAELVRRCIVGSATPPPDPRDARADRRLARRPDRARVRRMRRGDGGRRGRGAARPGGPPAPRRRDRGRDPLDRGRLRLDAAGDRGAARRAQAPVRAARGGRAMTGRAALVGRGAPDRTRRPARGPGRGCQLRLARGRGHGAARRRRRWLRLGSAPRRRRGLPSLLDPPCRGMRRPPQRRPASARRPSPNRRDRCSRRLQPPPPTPVAIAEAARPRRAPLVAAEPSPPATATLEGPVRRPDVRRGRCARPPAGRTPGSGPSRWGGRGWPRSSPATRQPRCVAAPAAPTPRLAPAVQPAIQSGAAHQPAAAPATAPASAAQRLTPAAPSLGSSPAASSPPAAPASPAPAAPPQVLIDRIEVITPPARAPAPDPMASLVDRRIAASRHARAGR